MLLSRMNESPNTAPAGIQRPRPTGFRQRLTLSAVALALCFVVFEVALRISEPPDLIDHAVNNAQWDGDENGLLHVRSKNRELVYELRPNASVFEHGFNQQFSTNSAGFRDREFITPKPQGIYRVIVVGDSIAFGWNQSADQLFPKLLEQRFIADGHPEVEVYNMAVDGYNSQQEVELIRTRALSYQPDLLLIAYCLNDNTYGADGGTWRHFQKSSSRAYDWLSLRCTRLQQQWSGKDITTTAFEDLAEIVAEQKLPVLVVVFPALTRKSDGSYPFLAQHIQLAGLADRLGFLLLDLGEPFLHQGFRNLQVHPNDVVHPNALGHQIASDSIYSFLNNPPDSAATTNWAGLPF